MADEVKNPRQNLIDQACGLGLKPNTAEKMSQAELKDYIDQISALVNNAGGVAGGLDELDAEPVEEEPIEEVTASPAAIVPKRRPSSEEFQESAADVRRELQSMKVQLYAEGTRKINISAEPQKGAPNIMYVGINGYPFWIKRGVDVTVPVAIIRVLRDAVQEECDQYSSRDAEGNHYSELRMRKVPRFNWQYVD